MLLCCWKSYLDLHYCFDCKEQLPPVWKLKHVKWRQRKEKNIELFHPGGSFKTFLAVSLSERAPRQQNRNRISFHILLLPPMTMPSLDLPFLLPKWQLRARKSCEAAEGKNSWQLEAVTCCQVQSGLLFWACYEQEMLAAPPHDVRSLMPWRFCLPQL